MLKVPRASLCITILDDEDYRVLMATRGGLEAFGVFVAVLIVGRERLQQGQARQLSESDSLRFDNSTTHVLALAHVTRKALDRALRALAEVAEETDTDPWMYLDESQHLVIRSFFKFNTSAGWGGQRPGAGRRPKNQLDSTDGNQDESFGNQVDSPLIPSPSPLPEGGVVAPAKVANDPAEVASVVELARKLFPCTGWEVSAERACERYRAAWVAEALQMGRDGNARSWPFFTSILERFGSQGASDAELRAQRPAAARASPGQPAPRLSARDEKRRKLDDLINNFDYSSLPDM